MSTVAVALAMAACATATLGLVGLARTAGRRRRVVCRLPASAAPRPPTGLRPPAGGGGEWRAGRRPAVPAPVRALLAGAGVAVEPATCWAAWLAAAGAAAGVALVAGGPALAVVVAGTAAASPVIVLRARSQAAATRLEAELPGVLEAVARSLRSGASLRMALDEAGARHRGPLGAELARVGREAAGGSSLVDALTGLAARRPLPAVRLATTALVVAIETGGAQARAIDGVAATVRERLAVAAEVRAQAAQARISALVIGLAPVAFGAFAAATDPRTADLLLRTPLGAVLLAAGLGLDVAGWWWMQRLIGGAR